MEEMNVEQLKQLLLLQNKRLQFIETFVFGEMDKFYGWSEDNSLYNNLQQEFIRNPIEYRLKNLEKSMVDIKTKLKAENKPEQKPNNETKSTNKKPKESTRTADDKIRGHESRLEKLELRYNRFNEIESSLTDLYGKVDSIERSKRIIPTSETESVSKNFNLITENKSTINSHDKLISSTTSILKDMDKLVKKNAESVKSVIKDFKGLQNKIDENSLCLENLVQQSSKLTTSINSSKNDIKTNTEVVKKTESELLTANTKIKDLKLKIENVESSVTTRLDKNSICLANLVQQHNKLASDVLSNRNVNSTMMNNLKLKIENVESSVKIVKSDFIADKKNRYEAVSVAQTRTKQVSEKCNEVMGKLMDINAVAMNIQQLTTLEDSVSNDTQCEKLSKVHDFQN